MDGGIVAALIGVGAAGGGGLWKLELNRVSRRDKRIEVLEATIRAKDALIDQLQRQNDRLQITADIQDKFFSELPTSTPRRRDPRRPA